MFEKSFHSTRIASRCKWVYSLPQAENEFSQKDNESYRRNHTNFSCNESLNNTGQQRHSGRCCPVFFVSSEFIFRCIVEKGRDMLYYLNGDNSHI